MTPHPEHLSKDIVERLRASICPDAWETSTLLDEAADEIERVREERNELARLNGKMPFMLDEIVRLKTIIGYLEDHADIPISVRRDARHASEPKP